MYPLVLCPHCSLPIGNVLLGCYIMKLQRLYDAQRDGKQDSEVIMKDIPEKFGFLNICCQTELLTLRSAPDFGYGATYEVTSGPSTREKILHFIQEEGSAQ